MDLLAVDVQHHVPNLAAGVVVARGCHDADVAGVDAWVQQALSLARTAGHGDAHKGAVRDLLRHGVYKPTGRGKPASEYLLQAALEDRFPRVMPLVDLANAMSLATLLPISLLDLGRSPSEKFCVRHGRAGGRYVFNRAGQELDLQDLLLLSTLPDDEPRANPVKDSMSTKLTDAASNVMAVIYGPLGLRTEVARAAEQLAALLQRVCHARASGHAVL